MNTTATHFVEGTDLPTYDHGFTDMSYLHLGHGNKITVPDQHVAYLRHLATAATNLADLIDKAHEPKVKSEIPDEWLPGDQVLDSDGDLVTRMDDGTWNFSSTPDVLAWGHDKNLTAHLARNEHARITHLVPRTNGAS